MQVTTGQITKGVSIQQYNYTGRKTLVHISHFRYILFYIEGSYSTQ